ncbi:PLP-dependent aminotransferase family protein [Cellulomonas cellasea]|uniref:DNA-binding transcriptional MocR family regulator n=1 Tax=Cellulomonas cellasea TaxID=43670 RepID=A0A7W4UHC2_9CELL|nr:PLP-dependent aminotransferase family protein [Cellulomonas cellasea]MBB2924186.1 DNA-binding transcriptional MocR family regulator [Cellulomonas cellasea]
MTDSSTGRIVADLTAWVTHAPAGSRLPPTRELVARYGVSPVTVQKALRTLAARGSIETRAGVGAFVRAQPTARTPDHGWQTAALGSPRTRSPQLSAALRVAPQDAIALHSGYPDPALLPDRLVRGAFGRAARGDVAVSRAPVAGLPELRRWFAAELGAASAPGVAPPLPGDVLVLPGSQSGLSAVFRAVVGAGRPLVVESPTYWGAILAAEQAGVRLVPVPSGPAGPEPEVVDRAFAQSGARALYCQPTFANPTGARWSADRAEQVLDVARSHGAFLVEDDWAHDLAITGDSTPLAARDDGGHVVHLRSLTKSVSPAVRVAAVVARGPARDRLLADAQAESMYVSPVLQAVALDVVTQPAWQTHLRHLRHQLAARRDLLVRALEQHVPGARLDAVPAGGLNLWLRLPAGTDLARLVRDCETAGVLVAPGDEWFPAEPTGPFLRLGYAGPDPGRFEEGARLLGAALALQGD